MLRHLAGSALICGALLVTLTSASATPDQALQAVPVANIVEADLQLTIRTPTGEMRQPTVRIPSLKDGYLLLNQKIIDSSEYALLIDPKSIVISDNVVYFNSVERLYYPGSDTDRVGHVGLRARTAFDCRTYSAEYIGVKIFDYLLDEKAGEFDPPPNTTPGSLYRGDVGTRLCSLKSAHFESLWEEHFTYLRRISPNIATIEELLLPHVDSSGTVRKLTDTQLLAFLRQWNSAFENYGRAMTTVDVSSVNAKSHSSGANRQAPDADSEVDPSYVENVVVTSSSTKLRAEASDASSVLQLLQKGERLPVVVAPGSTDQWINVVHVDSQREGFVKRADVQVLLSEAPASAQFEAIPLGRDADPEIVLVNKSDKALRVTLNAERHMIPARDKLIVTVSSGNTRFFAWAPGVIPTSGVNTFHRGYSYQWEFWVERSIGRRGTRRRR